MTRKTAEPGTPRVPSRRIPTACAALVVAAVAILAEVRPLFAQASPPPAGGTTVVIAPTRPLYFEAAIVVVLSGLALFAVCRSSRRN